MRRRAKGPHPAHEAGARARGEPAGERLDRSPDRRLGAPQIATTGGGEDDHPRPAIGRMRPEAEQAPLAQPTSKVGRRRGRDAEILGDRLQRNRPVRRQRQRPELRQQESVRGECVPRSRSEKPVQLPDLLPRRFESAVGDLARLPRSRSSHAPPSALANIKIPYYKRLNRQRRGAERSLRSVGKEPVTLRADWRDRKAAVRTRNGPRRSRDAGMERYPRLHFRSLGNGPADAPLGRRERMRRSGGQRKSLRTIGRIMVPNDGPPSRPARRRPTAARVVRPSPGGGPGPSARGFASPARGPDRA